jgi:hypothetical protein
LKKWDEATRFAQNALILLDALYAKRGMKIHKILNKEGTIDAKLFGEWRVKSYLVVALCCIERKDEDGAIAVLKKAKLVAMEFIDSINSKQQSSISNEESASLKGLTSQIKEVRRLMTDCTGKKKATRDMEKRRAQAMFSPVKEVPNKLSRDANDVDASFDKPSTPDDAVNNKTEQEARSTHQQEETSPNTPPPLKGVLNGKKGDRRNLRKTVSFSQKPPQIKEFDSTIDNEDAWYSKHKEALAMVAVAGLSVFAFVSLRKAQRS